MHKQVDGWINGSENITSLIVFASYVNRTAGCFMLCFFLRHIFLQVPEILDNILQANDGKWQKIAKKQSKTFFNPKKMDMKAQAKR